MTLLINGCSFAECWKPSDQFIEKLNCDSSANIGKKGTGIQRALRSTIEWIAQNGNPQFVIIPIPLHSRWEMSVGKDDDPVDGTWVSLQHPEYLDRGEIASDVSFADLKDMIERYYKIIPNVRTEWDKLFTEVIALSGFLESRGVKHLMFDMCNEFQLHHIKGYSGFSKVEMLRQNKSIIDIFGFCGNQFMYEQLPESKKLNVNPTMHHHDKEGYWHLENFLINYLNL